MISTEQKEHEPHVSKKPDGLIRAELREIVASPTFAQSSRLARFLRFIIENSLSGTTERLKETVIGMEVYDRPADYDPKVDSIVRSEARRLRKKLQEYYEREGRYSKIIITIPTGGYLPQIEVLPQPIRELAVVTPPPEGSGKSPEFQRTRLLTGMLVAFVVCGVGIWSLVRLHRKRSDIIATAHPSVSQEAYRRYLEGRFYWAKRTPDFVHKAIARFEESLRLQPNYALAYSGLADAYSITASGLPPLERSVRAKAAAERALALDPSSAEAHTSQAFILYKFDWNWQDSENHFRRAIQLNPNYALAHHWFGESLILRGRPEEGLAELRRAGAIEPLSLPIKNELARGLYRARLYDQAIAEARNVLDLDPNFSNAYATLTYAYEQKRDYRHAVDADLQVLRLAKRPEAKIQSLRRTFERSGWKAYWRAELGLLEDGTPAKSVSDYVLAELCVRTGDNQRALHLLEKSFDDRGDAALVIGVEPLMDPLRTDDRFVYLLRRSGLS